MKKLLLLAVSALFLNSCAYVQTHKNVEESFYTYQGYRLCEPLSLLQRGNDWYLVAEPVALQKSYPAIYDSVFFKDKNEPVFEMAGQGTESQPMMHRISHGTATVLQRADGYASLTTLCDELKMTPGEWIKAPLNHRGVPVRATLSRENETADIIVEEDSRTAQGSQIAERILSAADRVVVDIPGTVMYNVAIPFMAPFVFFREFLQED